MVVLFCVGYVVGLAFCLRFGCCLWVVTGGDFGLLFLLFVLVTVGSVYLIVLVINFKGGGFMYFVLSGFLVYLVWWVGGLICLVLWF